MLPAKASRKASFFQEVYELVKIIPPGWVMSYGQIALLLGHPKGSRLVGWAMHACPASLPWHRVVKKTGEIPLANPFQPERDQRKLLLKEGISFLPSGAVDMRKHQYHGEINHFMGSSE